jgi:bifunctional UDP-N-acetylglucosamine pyrophosphorylase/glucosamine-1-phosphate N-acetyltransferase
VSTAAVILAAGKGTRFKSDLPKVLHRAAGRTLLRHVLEAVRPLGLAQVIVVVGHQRELVEAEAASVGLDNIRAVVQEQQLGTGHAAEMAIPMLGDDVDRVLVLAGDTPLITTEALIKLLAAESEVTLLSGIVDDAGAYGRIIRGDDGAVEAIVEAKDATEMQLRVGEFNAGMYVFDRTLLVSALSGLDSDNAQGERYLTDVVVIARERGVTVDAVPVAVELVAGVNDRVQLAEVAAVLRARHLTALGYAGVTVVDPASTWVDVDVQIGPETVLLPGTMLEAGTVIGAGCEIGPHSRLVACAVADGATVTATHAREAIIGAGATVGPFAHLRPGTVLGVDTKAGAFTELKNTTLGDRSKVPHLAYVGDTTVGEDANLACGVITVNYDGAVKSRTIVEDGAFVGCDTALVAPVTVGKGAYVAAGSVITEDVPADALAVARSRQTTKLGWAAARRALQRE